MLDIPLDLSPGKELKYLTVTSSTEYYSDLMQRAVVMMLSGGYPILRINGLSLPEMLRQSTDAGMSQMGPMLASIGQSLTNLLNQDEDDTIVDNVRFTIGSLTGGRCELTIDIETVAGTELTRTLVIA